MKNKGQALVEFIIIMPVMILILLSVLEIGSYNYNKSKLEGLLSNVNNMYVNNESLEEINQYLNNNDKSIKLSINEDDKYSSITLSIDYKFITPGLEKILKNEIVVERVVYNE